MSGMIDRARSCGSILAYMSVALCAGLSTTAHAQDAAEGAENTGGDIVVTAQRKNERLQDVPAAVSAIGGDALAAQQISNVSEAVRSIPNLLVDLPYGDGGPPNFTIRGITSTDYSTNQSKPVAMYIDEGIRSFQLFEVMPMYDIERLEVLRGPQGTLYGRNATAGAVNVITKAPEFENSGYLTLGYGSYNMRKAQGAVNAVLVDDVLAARFAFSYQKDDGTIKNVMPGIKDASQTDVFSFRGSLRFTPVDGFDATLRYTHVNSGGRNYLPYTRNLDLSAFPASLAAVEGVDRSGLGFFQSASIAPGKRAIRWDGLNLQMNIELSDSYTVKSVTTYDWGRYRDLSDSAGLPILWSVVDSAAKNVKQFYQEVRIESGYDGPFNWMAGAAYNEDRVRVAQQYGFFYDERCGSDCDFFGGEGLGYFSYNSFLQKRTGKSAFLKGDFEVTPEFNLHGGVRFSRDTLRGSDYDGYVGDSADPRMIESFVNQKLGDNFTNTSFEAGADYKVLPDVLLYAAYKEGYRTGAMNAGAQTSIDELSIAAPETAQSYEVGVKSQLFDRLMTFNVALSRTDYKNQQIVSSENSLVPVLVSIPKSRIYALEAETVIRPAHGVSFYGNLGLTDAKYKKTSADAGDIVGNRLIASAKVNAAIGGSWDVVSLDAGTLTLRGNANYLSKRYFDRFNTESIAQKGYWLADASMGWDADAYSVSVGVKNMFDKKYFTSCLALANQGFGYDFCQRGERRRLSVEATYRF